MSLEKQSQELIVFEPDDAPSDSDNVSVVPLEVFEGPTSESDVVSDLVGDVIGDFVEQKMLDGDGDGDPLEVEIIIDDIPGAPKGTQDPVIEVSEDDSDQENEDKEDDNSASDSWNLLGNGPENYVVRIKEKLDSIPKHSGYDTAGLERAIAYLEKLDRTISKDMRSDLEGSLDANKIEEIRAQIDNGLESLHLRLDKVNESKKNRKKNAYINKNAQKITGVQGIYVTVPLLISRLARICINGTVSAGHDLEDLYKKQVDKFNLNNREQAELMQLLSDMGFPIRQDRGLDPNEDVDTTSSDNFDWAANYPG